MESILNMDISSENYSATNPMNIDFNLQLRHVNYYDNLSFQPPPSFIGPVELPEEIIEERNEENIEQNFLGIKRKNKTISNGPFDLSDELMFEDEYKFLFEEQIDGKFLTKQKGVERARELLNE